MQVSLTKLTKEEKINIFSNFFNKNNLKEKEVITLSVKNKITKPEISQFIKVACNKNTSQEITKLENLYQVKNKNIVFENLKNLRITTTKKKN